MSNSEAYSAVLIWFTTGVKPCVKCALLNGTSWLNVDITQKYLVDARFGIVYDMELNQSLVHQHCQCHVEVMELNVDLEKLQVW